MNRLRCTFIVQIVSLQSSCCLAVQDINEYHAPGSEIDYQHFKMIASAPKNANKTYILYAYSPNCPHCRLFNPQWQTFLDNGAKHAKNIEYFKMDATKNENKKIVNQFF